MSAIQDGAGVKPFCSLVQSKAWWQRVEPPEAEGCSYDQNQEQR